MIMVITHKDILAVSCTFFAHKDSDDFSKEKRDPPLIVETSEITKGENAGAIRAIENNKATDWDEITGEMLTHGGKDLVARLTKLLNTCWRKRGVQVPRSTLHQLHLPQFKLLCVERDRDNRIVIGIRQCCIPKNGLQCADWQGIYSAFQLHGTQRRGSHLKVNESKED